MSLHILYTNDLHNHTAPLARIGEFRVEQESLLLDGGDALRGSNTAWRWTEPVLDWMRRLGYRAMAMGNREFHYFRWVHRWREQEREFPLLACNLEDLRMAQWSWRRYIRFTWSGYRVGVIGATPVQYPVGSRWEALTGFRFLDPLKCIPALVEEVRPQVDLLLLLSHLGLRTDLQVAELGLPVDLVLGGHSHDLTPEPIWRGKVPVVQGGANGRFLGELRVEPGGRELTCKFHHCA